MSLPSDESLQLFVRVSEAVQITKYTLLCSAFIIFYDYVISFDREVELIWRKRWSIIKAVYIWHRYFGVFCTIFALAVFMSHTVSDSFCYFWIRWETWGYSIVVFTTESVLLMWIFVVYDKNIWILGFASCLLLAEVAAVAAILAESLPSFHAKAGLIPGITFCFVEHAPPFFHVYWTPILAYHTIIFILYLTKGWMVYTQGGRHQWKSTGLLETIYKDSLVNFLAIFASYLACAVMWLVADPFLAQVPVGFALSLSITGCNRLLLNIRYAYFLYEGDPSRVARGTTFKISRLERGESQSSFWTEAGAKPTRPTSIYAEYTPRDLWAFELREMKWSGKLNH